MATQPPMNVPPVLADSRDTNGVIGHFDEDLARRRAAFNTTVAGLFDDAVVRDEVIRLRSADHTRCEYCRNVRKRQAHDAGLREDDVERMRRGRHDHLGEAEQASLALAEDFYVERPADIAAARAVLGDEGLWAVVLDLVRHGAGGHAMVALGLEPGQQERVLV